MKDIFKKAQLNYVGYGGLKCPCCNPWMRKHKSPRNKQLNRLARRHLNNEFRKTLDIEYGII